MPRGGRRPGAGRKRKVEEQEKRAELAKAIPRHDVLARLARAIEVGEQWAITLYLAYDWGKPRESIEHSGPEGEGIVFQVIYPHADDSPA